MKYSIEVSDEFQAWYDHETGKSQSQVAGRVERIAESGHFGDAKYLGEGLSELRWKSGRRVYFALISEQVILLLIGGNKNGQKKDIKKARLLNQKYEDAETQAWPPF